jgi:hypothetical protein
VRFEGNPFGITASAARRAAGMSWYNTGRDSIGGSVVVGDTRWAGTFGVEADFVARSHCSIEIIASEDIEVRLTVLTHKQRISMLRPIEHIEGRD